MKDYLHLRAPGNWINDPNGFIFYRGQYHLFYQHFPYAPCWGTMHWGHAVSSDLVHWEHKGVALFPSKYYDRNGVFSGSAVEQDGRLFLYYTAIRYQEQDPENIHHAREDRFTASQAMLVSEDGVHFDNWNAKRQIIPTLISLFVAWPVLLTQITGLVQQAKLDDQVLSLIESQIRALEQQAYFEGTNSPAGSGPMQDFEFCTSCGAKIPAQAKFCSQCGTKLR